MDISTFTLWTGPFPIERVSGYFYYSHVLRNFVNLIQTVLTLIRRRVLRRLIWSYTVCQCPFYGAGGLVWRRCPIAFVTGVPNWYWLTVVQGLLSLQQIRVEGEYCYFLSFLSFFHLPLSSLSLSFLCFLSFFHFPLSSLSLSFISSTISSISFLRFSRRRHRMTHKELRVVKPQHNQKTLLWDARLKWVKLLHFPYMIKSTAQLNTLGRFSAIFYEINSLTSSFVFLHTTLRKHAYSNYRKFHLQKLNIFR